mgnify:CR=1 FL=1
MQDKLLSKTVAMALGELELDGDLVITFPSIEPVADRMMETWPNALMVLGGASLGFSDQACDGCSSPLAGDRFPATVWWDDFYEHVTPVD